MKITLTPLFLLVAAAVFSMKTILASGPSTNIDHTSCYLRDNTLYLENSFSEASIDPFTGERSVFSLKLPSTLSVNRHLYTFFADTEALSFVSFLIDSKSDPLAYAEYGFLGEGRVLSFEDLNGISFEEYIRRYGEHFHGSNLMDSLVPNYMEGDAYSFRYVDVFGNAKAFFFGGGPIVDCYIKHENILGFVESTPVGSNKIESFDSLSYPFDRQKEELNGLLNLEAKVERIDGGIKVCLLVVVKNDGIKSLAVAKEVKVLGVDSELDPDQNLINLINQKDLGIALKPTADQSLKNLFYSEFDIPKKIQSAKILIQFEYDDRYYFAMLPLARIITTSRHWETLAGPEDPPVDQP